MFELARITALPVLWRKAIIVGLWIASIPDLVALVTGLATMKSAPALVVAAGGIAAAVLIIFLAWAMRVAILVAEGKRKVK